MLTNGPLEFEKILTKSNLCEYIIKNVVLKKYKYVLVSQLSLISQA